MGTGRVLTGTGLAATVAAVVVALLANTSNPPSGQSASPELRVPLALAGTRTNGSIGGPAAPAEVSRLPGTRIAASDPLDAGLQHGSPLWISAFPSALEASRMLWRMHCRMAGGTMAVSAPRPPEVRDRVLWLTVLSGSHALAAVQRLRALSL